MSFMGLTLPPEPFYSSRKVWRRNGETEFASSLTSNQMSSWQYAFLFPQSPNPLCPRNATRHLTDFGAEFDGSIRINAPIDDEGHLFNVGEEIDLREPFERELKNHLENGKSFSIQLRSTDIVLSVEFILESRNPRISIGWSRHLFDKLLHTIQSDFWKAIRSFAKECNAAYVVIVDDAPDHFEDRFLEIEGRRMIDLDVNHGYGLGLREVWLQLSAMVTLPEGASYVGSEDIGEGFQRHFVV